MRSTALRSTLALGLVAGLFAGCADVMSALNIFLVRFSYKDGGVGEIQGPKGYQDATTALTSSSPLAKAQAIANLSSLVGGSSVSAITNHFTTPSNWTVNLNLNLLADNSGNSDEASFPLSTGLSLFVQSLDNTPLKAGLSPFSVSGGEQKVLPVSIPVNLGLIPDATFKSMVKGDSIPYFLRGKVGFDLKSPTGEKLSTHETDLDIATSKVPTRPSDAQTAAFVNAISSYIK